METHGLHAMKEWGRTMKKILAVLVLLVVAGAGALYWLGGYTERLFRTEMTQAGPETYPGLELVVTDYQRGLFGAHTRVCLHLGEQAGNFPPRFADIMSHVCLVSTLRYGPLLFGPEGVRTGWAGWRTAVDVAALPKEARSILKALFGDAPPMVDTGRFAFDGSVHEHTTITPIDRQVGPLHVTLGALSLDAIANRAGDINAGSRGYLTLKTLRVDGPKGGLAIDGIDGDVAVEGMVMPGLPLMTATFAVNGMTISQGGKPVLGANLTVRTGNRVAGGLMDADYGLWFDDLHGPLVTLPVNNGYLGIQDRGLSVSGLRALNGEAKRFNALQQRILAASGKKDADSVMQMTDAGRQLRQQVARIETVLLDKVLQPGKSALSLQLLLNRNDQRQLTLTGDLHYRGVDGKSPTLARLAAMGPPGWLRLANAEVRFNAAPAALPPALIGQLPALMRAGVLSSDADGRLNGELTLNNGALTLNGRATSPGQLARSLPGAPPAAPAGRE